MISPLVFSLCNAIGDGVRWTMATPSPCLGIDRKRFIFPVWAACMNAHLKQLVTTNWHRIRNRTLALWVVSVTLMSCVGTVNAGTCQNNLQPSNPDAVYTIHTNGTVTDGRTGLMWKVCSEAQTWSSSTCAGSASFVTWPEAIAQGVASTFAGYSDWRLPNLKELHSLVEECRVNPSINEIVFPSTPSKFFWSASPSVGSQSQSMFVEFGSGVASADYRNNNLQNDRGYVRLVRSRR